MVEHAQRLEAARDVVRFICSRSETEMATLVPNCPGWTVRNAAVHIGRVGVAWHSMVLATPDDPDSRVRGYADAEARGSGHDAEELGSWMLGAIDAMEGDTDRPCYFSMTGGHGTAGLWGRHAATELGIHRLDVEHALGRPYAISDELAIDALRYTAEFFLPAMARVTERDPGALRIAAADVVMAAPGSNGEPAAEIDGSPVDTLLALWGRPHEPLAVSGDESVLAGWRQLPSEAFQFGTWD